MSSVRWWKKTTKIFVPWWFHGDDHGINLWKTIQVTRKENNTSDKDIRSFYPQEFASIGPFTTPGLSWHSPSWSMRYPMNFSSSVTGQERWGMNTRQLKRKKEDSQTRKTTGGVILRIRKDSEKREFETSFRINKVEQFKTLKCCCFNKIHGFNRCFQASTWENKLHSKVWYIWCLKEHVFAEFKTCWKTFHHNHIAWLKRDP